MPPIRDRLLMLKGQQETYRRLCGKSYNRDYLGYLCVDEIGNIIRPNYVSEQFPKLLEKTVCVLSAFMTCVTRMSSPRQKIYNFFEVFRAAP